MTILKVYLIKQSLTGAEIITNIDGVPLSPFAISAIDMLYTELENGNIKVITNRYGPTGIFNKTVFEDEFNVPELSKKEGLTI